MSERQVFEGLRVVDLSTGMAGPMATMVLADHGADVLKLEPRDGDWARELPAFAMWNRQKRSACVDLRRDRELVAELLATADVVVMGADLDAPGSPVVDHDSAVARNPGLVRCGIGGLARTGPQARSPRAYEGIVAAATGRMWGLDQLSGGQPGPTYDEPAFTAAPVAAYGASQLAVQGILAALLQRRRTGRGQRVETSLLDGAMAFLMRQELSRGEGGESRAISPAMHRGIELCFLTAECSDGRYIQMCARQDAHFKNWLHALDLGDVLSEERYRDAPMGIPTVADVDELRERIAARMRTRTQSEWMRVFTEDYDVGADPFLTPGEFLEHPDMVANDRIVEIDDPHRGRVRQIGALVWMSETPAAITRPAPS
ncbi:MAG: CoA transferase, partial [Ilumatobacteraceae bacterium]